MKRAIMIMALFALGGCNAVNKLTGQESKPEHHDPVVQDFFGITYGPSPITVIETPNAATASLEVFVCTNACVKTDLSAYLIPVYESIQSGIVTPYAMWSYNAPNLQVVFQNYAGSDTVQYIIRSHP